MCRLNASLGKRHDTYSTQRSPVHRVQLHCASNWDTHLYPPHNNSSVFLTITTYVRRSGRIINRTWSGRTTPQDSALQFQTPAHTRPEWPSQEEPGSAQPPPHRCRTFPILPVQMGYGLRCRTNRRPCRPPLSNPSTPTDYMAWRFWRWDNRMAAQHLPRYLGGLAVDKRSAHSNERRRTEHVFPIHNHITLFWIPSISGTKTVTLNLSLKPAVKLPDNTPITYILSSLCNCTVFKCQELALNKAPALLITPNSLLLYTVCDRRDFCLQNRWKFCHTLSF